jgi:hypothetical protein
MSEWREDNFLERLANDGLAGTGRKLCPEAEILRAVAHHAGTSTISIELRKHLELCPACSDLQRRLAMFDQPVSVDLDSQALEAERRLDSWIKGLLASRTLDVQAPRPAAFSVPTTSGFAALLNPM